MSEIVGHLERQVASSRRLLGIVLAQADAIRSQDVEGVLARLADVQAELAVRQRLEIERDSILHIAAARLGIDTSSVDLEGVLDGCPAHEAEQARALSAELRGLLLETQRTHDQNRVLIRQELSFLSHLMSIISGAPRAGYSPDGWTEAPQSARTVDARA
jgi:flagellar FlgN protein